MQFSSAKLLINVGKRNFHISKCKLLFYEDPEKQGYRIRSDQEKNWNKLPFKDKIRAELKLGKEGLKKFTSNFIEGLIQGPRYFVYDHEVDIIWKFTGNKKELNDWIISTDKDYNFGLSTAQ
jgi:hypothetical protein